MNIQRRNVSSERILILFSNTTDLFSVAVSKDFPQTIMSSNFQKTNFHQKAEKMLFFLDIFNSFDWKFVVVVVA
jgi:hypothetical protein